MNSPEQQRAEKTRLESIKQAKAQLKGDDETLWQAAVTRLESLEPLDGEAMFLLGASYTFPNGISGISGIKHDEKLACQWFKKAADADNKRGKHYAELPPCTNYKS
jgi:TPR repeat protein